MTGRYDAIVVGGGHNGLVCAAYLARAGVSVLVLEARDTVGGMASTVDALGDARVNICNCDHSLVRGSGVIEQLGLADHGLRYLEMDAPILTVPWAGGKPWLQFHEIDRTLQSLALTHPTQVKAYQRYLDELLPAAELVLAMMATAPTPAAVSSRLLRTRGRGMRAVMALSRRSAAGVLRDYFGSEALLGSPASTGPAVWGQSAESPGTGLGALGFALRHLLRVGRPVGGSGALTDALAAAIVAGGGTVRTGARVAQIHSTGGSASGVTLTSGERIDAPIVVSAGDPRATLVDLLQDPPAAAGKLAARWRERPAHEGYESKIDAVVSAPPRPLGLTDEYLSALGVEEALKSTIVMAPTLDQIAGAARSAARGEIAAHPPMLANVPSLLDPSVEPGFGGHVFSLEVLFTPYSLRGGWRGSPEPERWLNAFAERMEPGFLEGVKRWRVVTPEDYERDFAMPRGYAPSFGASPLQAMIGRDRELTRYATPLPGLFLTGSGTFPGAGVSGAPGRNAAQVILRSLDRPARAVH